MPLSLCRVSESIVRFVWYVVIMCLKKTQKSHINGFVVCHVWWAFESDVTEGLLSGVPGYVNE